MIQPISSNPTDTPSYENYYNRYQPSPYNNPKEPSIDKVGGENSSAKGQCETCENRKYTDGSNDPGVSYKTPTTINASKAASAVRAHEFEHVSKERSKALSEDRKVINQSVSLTNSICPECGSTYISGGTTKTVTKSNETASVSPSGYLGMDMEEKGNNIDVRG